MARQIHWRMPFTSLDGMRYVAEIYHENYTGEIVTLNGSDNPFVVSESADDDFFNPFVLSTGYISFFKTEAVDNDIYPSSAKSHFVKLMKADGAVVWTGYIKPEIYSQPWDSLPYVVELPIQDQLSVMLSGEISINTYDTESIMDILRDKVFSEMEYDNVIFPHDWALAPNYPMLTKVIGTAWTDDGKEISVEEFLTDFLNYWHLSLRAHGNTLYFIGHHATSYNIWTWDKFFSNGTGSELPNIHIDANELTPVTDDGEMQIIPPYKKIIVKGEVVSSTELGGIRKDGLKYSETTTVSSIFDHPTLGDRVRALLYNTPNRYMQFYSYKHTLYSGNKNWEKTDWDKKVILRNQLPTTVIIASANWFRADIYKSADVNKDKKSYKYQEYIALASMTNFYMDMYEFVNILPPVEELHNYPLASMLLSDCFFAVNGCLKISVGNMITPFADYGYKLNYLYAILRIGDKYWDGKVWGKEKKCFGIEISPDNKIVSNKTIDMLYENADDGYIIPIDQNIFGPLELFLTMQNTDVWINGLSINYCPPETTDIDKDKKSKIKYESMIFASAQGEKNIDLGLISYNNAYGLNTVQNENNTPVSNLTNNWSGTIISPEEAIIESANHDLSYPREMINASFAIAAINPITAILDNGKKYNINTIEYRFRDAEMRLSLIETKQFRQEEIVTNLRTYQDAYNAVSNAIRQLWPLAMVDIPEFERDFFEDWLLANGIRTSNNGDQTSALINTIERLYPESEGAFTKMEKREDRIAGLTFVDTLCEHLRIRY